MKRRAFITLLAAFCLLLFTMPSLSACAPGERTLEATYSYAETGNFSDNVYRRDYTFYLYSDGYFVFSTSEFRDRGTERRTTIEGTGSIRGDGRLTINGIFQYYTEKYKFGRRLSSGSEEMNDFEFSLLTAYSQIGYFKIIKGDGYLYFKENPFVPAYTVLPRNGEPLPAGTVLEYMTECERFRASHAFENCPYNSDFALVKTDEYDLTTPEGKAQFLSDGCISLTATVIGETGAVTETEVALTDISAFDLSKRGSNVVTLYFTDANGSPMQKVVGVTVYDSEDYLPINRAKKTTYVSDGYSEHVNYLVIERGKDLYEAGGYLLYETYGGTETVYLSVNNEKAEPNPAITVKGYDKTQTGLNYAALKYKNGTVSVCILTYDELFNPVVSVRSPWSAKLYITENDNGDKVFDFSDATYYLIHASGAEESATLTMENLILTKPIGEYTAGETVVWKYDTEISGKTVSLYASITIG